MHTWACEFLLRVPFSGRFEGKSKEHHLGYPSFDTHPNVPHWLSLDGSTPALAELTLTCGRKDLGHDEGAMLRKKPVRGSPFFGSVLVK